jgi:hypothetical protein
MLLAVLMAAPGGLSPGARRVFGNNYYSCSSGIKYFALVYFRDSITERS